MKVELDTIYYDSYSDGDYREVSRIKVRGGWLVVFVEKNGGAITSSMQYIADCLWSWGEEDE